MLATVMKMCKMCCQIEIESLPRSSRLIYFHLTLTHTKGQGNAQFDCECLEIMKDRGNVSIFIESHTWTLEIDIFTLDRAPL